MEPSPKSVWGCMWQIWLWCGKITLWTIGRNIYKPSNNQKTPLDLLWHFKMTHREMSRDSSRFILPIRVRRQLLVMMRVAFCTYMYHLYVLFEWTGKERGLHKLRLGQYWIIASIRYRYMSNGFRHNFDIFYICWIIWTALGRVGEMVAIFHQC